MSSAPVRILIVGPHFPILGVTADRFSLLGWACRIVDTLKKARAAFLAEDVDVVLVSEALPDGRGHELAPAVALRSRTLLVSEARSEDSLWIPVVDQGKRVLGTRVIPGSALESKIAILIPDVAIKQPLAAAAPAAAGAAAAARLVVPVPLVPVQIAPGHVVPVHVVPVQIASAKRNLAQEASATGAVGGICSVPVSFTGTGLTFSASAPRIRSREGK